jgi:hypothetical protein
MGELEGDGAISVTRGDAGFGRNFTDRRNRGIDFKLLVSMEICSGRGMTLVELQIVWLDTNHGRPVIVRRVVFWRTSSLLRLNLDMLEVHIGLA